MNVEGLVARTGSELDPLVTQFVACALLDFPNHSNVGDSAIWLGEIDYLRKLKCKVIHNCDSLNYNPELVEECCPDHPIFIHGGGDFGDLWPSHQQLREDILRRLKGRPIAQFPQTIHFQSPERLESAQRAVAEHGDFVLFVRDQRSLDFAVRHFECEAHLCPDMAFSMERSRLKQFPPSKEVACVYLSRTDLESRKEKSNSLPKDVLATDWLDEQLPKSAKYYRIVDRFERRQWARRTLPLQRVRLRLSEILAQKRLERGCRILCQSERVVTDRLHGMILASLLGRSVYAFDNSYGKLSSFYQTWKEFLTGVLFFDNEEEAISAALS